MAATVSIKEVNGTAPGSASTVASISFCTSDTATPGTSNPMVKPSAGTNRSYWKTLYLNADTAPSGTINNVKFYTDGTIGWTGATLFAGTTATYTQATGTQGTTGTDSAVATTNAATLTVSAPLSVAGTLTGPSTGKVSDYVVLQVDLSTSATAGTFAAETLTFSYDET